MSGWLSSKAVVGAVLTIGATSGCAAFMDLGVDKYRADDDGGVAPSADASVCDAPGCVTLSLACRSALDCDAGDVCCLVPTTPTSVQLACEPGVCSGAFSFQLCASDAECKGSAGATCVRQQCTLEGVVVRELGACGTLPGCVSL